MTNALVGGLLIGIAAAWLLLSAGRVAGISGIVANGFRGSAWAWCFLAGLAAGGYLATLWVGSDWLSRSGLELTDRAVPMLLLGGVLVGYGTRLGSGCTSGHGVCGTARLSRRSISATVTFLAVGMLVATLVHGTGVGR